MQKEFLLAKLNGMITLLNIGRLGDVLPLWLEGRFIARETIHTPHQSPLERWRDNESNYKRSSLFLPRLTLWNENKNSISTCRLLRISIEWHQQILSICFPSANAFVELRRLRCVCPRVAKEQQISAGTPENRQKRSRSSSCCRKNRKWRKRRKIGFTLFFRWP